MNGILTLILIVSSQVALANVKSHTETDTITKAESSHILNNVVVNQATHSSDLTLIENLLSGLDFRLEDAVIPSPSNLSSENTFFVTLDLVVVDQNNQQTSISLFTSDDFSANEGYVNLSKEFFVSGSEMFRALEPSMIEIESSSNLHLRINLHRSNLVPMDGRKVGEAIDSEIKSSVYSSQLSFQDSSLGFKQDIELPDTFSFTENSEITDLGFGLYFR